MASHLLLVMVFILFLNVQLFKTKQKQKGLLLKHLKPQQFAEFYNLTVVHSH